LSLSFIYVALHRIRHGGLSPLHHGGRSSLLYGGLSPPRRSFSNPLWRAVFPFYSISISTHLHGEKPTTIPTATNTHVTLTITDLFSSERPSLEPPPISSTAMKAFVSLYPNLCRLPPKPPWLSCTLIYFVLFILCFSVCFRYYILYVLYCVLCFVFVFSLY